MTAPDQTTALYDGIDRVVLPVSDLDAACAPFERLGLVVSPEIRPRDRNIGIRTLPVGGPDNLFGIEFLTSTEPTNVVTAGGLSAIVLRVADMATVLGTLAERGIQATAHTVYGADGFKRLDLAVLPDLPDAAVSLRLIEPVANGGARLAEYTRGQAHALPLKRLDHLAAVAPDLERSCRFWDEVLGVPTVGEVISPTTVVRQLRIGDAMFELLGPASEDSPIRQRPPGLSSSCSFEVDDLDAVVEQIRAAGVEVPDPRVGTLPGTRVTTVPASEMSGLNLQLLQYV
jgi:catechol 2,3-dioxygenase-like lactoylglutathione lyase family enzyme